MIARARHAVIYQDMDDQPRDEFARRFHDPLAACSCWMRGNPRKYNGERTIQERRSDLSWLRDVEETRRAEATDKG